MLASGIAHDFNNLLTAIMCNISLAESRLGRDDEGKGILTEAEHAAGRAADLCRQMIAYAGKGQFVEEEIDLNEVAGAALKELRHEIPLGLQLALPGPSSEHCLQSGISVD